MTIKPLKLHLQNFTSYIDTIIDFEKFKSPLLICGDNGNGKSSIIDAITTALYCRARGSDSRGSGIEDLINKDANEFKIDYTFEMNNHIYQIIRIKSKNSQKLKFFIDNIDQTSSLKETQLLINNIIKIDYNTFLDTVYISQNKSSSFVMKSPKERKDIFSQILNLEDYNNLEKFTRDLKKELTNEYELKQQLLKSLNNKIAYKDEYISKLNNYIQELNNIDIESLQNELESLLALQSKIDTINSKNQLILNQRKQLQNQIQRYKNNIQKNENELSTLIIDNINDLQKQLKLININNIENEIQKLQIEYNDKKINYNLLRKQLDILKIKKKNILNYNKAICEFCGNHITDEYKEHYINELNISGKNISQQFLTMKNELIDLENIINEKKIKCNELQKQINDINKRITLSTINQDKKNNLLNTIKELKNELVLSEKELNINLQEEIIQVNKIDTFKINELKNKINELIENKNTYISKIAILKDRLKQIDEYIIQVQELQKEINKLSTQIDDYKSLINAFSKDGIQSYIIENTLPEIEEEINNLLKELTDDKITISFILQKETKAKTMIDTLDILINERNINRKYETFSGGEKFRIDFACHVGLSRFLAKRADAKIDLFVLDENLGSQDETAKQIFIQYISKLTKYFKMILIITHINDIKEAFINKLFVVKDETGSHIK